jgi:hypothetical protein
MKKKFLMMLMALTMSAATYAQFEQGKMYASAGLSGLGLNFNSNEKWKLDIMGRVGYLFADNLMVTAQGQFGYRRYEPNYFTLGAGARYYILQNGLYLGASANYVHETAAGYKVDDFRPSVQIGYAFFLSRTVTIEPELYYNQSFKNHSDFSGFGLRIGFGIYLGKD